MYDLSFNLQHYCITAELVIRPMSIIRYVNTTVTLSCKATTSGIIRYQWRRVNKEITSDRANGVNTSTLTISPVTEQDEDEYYCVANYSTVNGTLHNVTSSKANIIIYGEEWTLHTSVNNILQPLGPPTVQPISVNIPVGRPISPVYYVVAGDQLRLNCRATNDPQSPNQLRFIWYKDSTSIGTQNARQIIVTVPNVNSLLFFNNLLNQDNGTYTCSVYNFKLSRAVTQSAVTQSAVVIVECKYIPVVYHYCSYNS